MKVGNALRQAERLRTLIDHIENESRQLFDFCAKESVGLSIEDANRYYQEEYYLTQKVLYDALSIISQRYHELKQGN